MSVEARAHRASLAEIASPVVSKKTRPLRLLNEIIVKELSDLITLSRTPEARCYQPGEGKIAGPLRTQAFIREVQRLDNIRLASNNLNRDPVK